MSAKRRVAYYYQWDIGHHYYGPGHPMKPARLKLTHHLILAFGLYRKLEIYKPHLASAEELARFHSDDYVDFLRRVTPEAAKSLSAYMTKFNCGEYTDCPIFDDLYGFCQSYAGASVDGAVRLNHGAADIAINWSGGLHHAKKGEASGFCYVNDIVLGILELLKYHQRVLYIDIDVHHGDGVEEAFYTTDRVMTVSFHKFGDFFPGTGSIRDTGARAGKNYSVNFPLQEGIDDLGYEHIFKPVMAKVMETFRPGAVVLQCGADSLSGDRLGCFNLTLRGHGECVRFIKSYGLPTLVVGGGGYTIRNVARCWANETAVVLDEALPDAIPPNDYIEYYKPDYRLHLDPNPSQENLNSREYLEKCKAVILENLRYLESAPSVQFQDVPPDSVLREVDEDAARSTHAAAAAAAANRGPGGGVGAGFGPCESALGEERRGGSVGLYEEGRRQADGEAFEHDRDHDAGTQQAREAEQRQLAEEAAATAAVDVQAGAGTLRVEGTAEGALAAEPACTGADAAVTADSGCLMPLDGAGLDAQGDAGAEAAPADTAPALPLLSAQQVAAATASISEPVTSML